VDADVRFVAATHRDLERMVAERQFREDLFWRLNVVPIVLPPLRERGAEDIRMLVTHYVAAIGRENGWPDARIEAAALARLCAEPWPGNVRQLENFVERLLVLGDGPVITAAQVTQELGNASRLAPVLAEDSGETAPPATAGADAASQEAGSLQTARRAAERDALVEALRRCHENRTRAARLLGVSRRTLHYKLKEHGIAS
jgi:two-component system response regulator AtoC